MDLFVGQESGAEICAQLLALNPRVNVLLISGAGRISPNAAKAAGASGFISKDWPAADIAGAVRMVGLGMTVFKPHEAPAGPPLSEREREVLEAIASGATNREIAGDAVPQPAHRQGAHLLAVPQAQRAQPRRGGPESPASGPHFLTRGCPPPNEGVAQKRGCDRGRRVSDGAGVSNATQPAALFPGQGSHTPEMRDLVAQRAPELLEKVTELVGEDPFARVEENTRFAQPAIFCASVVGWDALDLHPSAGAGHSLGELAALVAAGVLKRDDALELVVLRGRLMGEARNGSMLALVGATLEDARGDRRRRRRHRRQRQRARPGRPLRRCSTRSTRPSRSPPSAARRVIRLDVAGAFHSPLMEPAVAPFRAALDEVEIGEPSFTVYSCASAAPFTDVREELANALTRPVRWRETVIAMHEAGAPSFVEVGPGKVLARMGKRILKGVPFETPAEGLVHA